MQPSGTKIKKNGSRKKPKKGAMRRRCTTLEDYVCGRCSKYRFANHPAHAAGPAVLYGGGHVDPALHTNAVEDPRPSKSCPLIKHSVEVFRTARPPRTGG
jgi:hypothetical protein